MVGDGSARTVVTTVFVPRTVVGAPGTVMTGGCDPFDGADVFGGWPVVVTVVPCPGRINVLGGGAGGAGGVTVPVVVLRSIDATTDVEVTTAVEVTVSVMGTGV